jgi:aminopeptidase-like protein
MVRKRMSEQFQGTIQEWGCLSDQEATRREFIEDIQTLFPLCRSVTGEGLRQSLAFLRKYVDLTLEEVPTGTTVLDWKIPPEWTIRDAYIKDLTGTRVVDFQKSNLNIVQYSIPVRCRMTLEELTDHLHSLPEQPDLIPYRTSYYEENWGFCLSQNSRDALCAGDYEVCIDSTLEPGSLTYGEFFVPGEIEEEFVFSAHSCHPSLCNDNLSGMLVMAKLAQIISNTSMRYSYRFIWAPGAIGAITWLSRNEARLQRIRHGLILSCLGLSDKTTYKKSRKGNHEIDRAFAQVAGELNEPTEIREFSPVGYDERQYCSPGFDLPFGCFMRVPNGEFPEYHTSADNPSLIDARAMVGSLETLVRLVHLVDSNRSFKNLFPKGEPQLGKRGLYNKMGGFVDTQSRQLALLWVLNLSDGNNSLLDISERSDLPYQLIEQAAQKLKQSGLLSPCSS